MKRILPLIPTALLLFVSVIAKAVGSAAPSPQYAAIVQIFVDGINTRNPELLVEKIRYDMILDEALEDLPVNKDFKAGMRHGVLRDTTAVGRNLLRNMGEGAAARIMRWRKFGGGYNALVRINMELGVNYIDLFVRPVGEDELAIVDMYMLNTGEKLSQTMRNMAAFANPEPSLLERVMGKGSSKQTDQFVRLLEAFQKQDFAGFRSIYLNSGDAIRAQKIASLLAYQVATTQVNDQQFLLRVLEDINTHHGNDPGMALMLIDYYLFEEDYDAAIEAVERLQKISGNADAVLLSIKGNLALAKGDIKAAKQYAIAGIQAEPDIEETYFTLADVYEAEGNYPELVQTLQQLSTDFGYVFELDYFRNNPEYEAFVQSDAFKTWAGSKE